MPDPAPPTWGIEKLAKRHDRSQFACGHESLDDFIRKYAGQNERTGISQTFVALETGEKTVCGYYSLSAGSVGTDALPEELQRRLPRYPVPVAHLGRLAVDVKSRGFGLGEFLLLDALARILLAADAIGIHAVEVRAIDERARRFYLKYGFTRLADDDLHLYLPLKEVRKLGLRH